MRNQIKSLLANKGQEPVINSIDKSISDFKQLGYYREEIKETIRDIFFGLDSKIDKYIISKGY